MEPSPWWVSSETLSRNRFALSGVFSCLLPAVERWGETKEFGKTGAKDTPLPK